MFKNKLTNMFGAILKLIYAAANQIQGIAVKYINVPNPV